MKKVITSTLLLVITMIFVTGCGSEKITTCTSESNQSASGYSHKTEYKIKSYSNLVSSVDVTEEIESTNETILSYFDKLLKEQYENLNNLYGGYKSEVSKEASKVLSKVSIDYEKINMDKLVNDNPSLKDFINKDGKITLDGIKALYESTGAKCDK